MDTKIAILEKRLGCALEEQERTNPEIADLRERIERLEDVAADTKYDF
jgi:hypothetical protein